MFRFRLEVMFLVLVVLRLSGAVGLWWPTGAEAFKSAVRNEGIYPLLAFVSTAVLIGATGGLRRRLPNYAGAPPVRDLIRILCPYVVAGLLATANLVALSALLGTTPDTNTGMTFALYVARAMNLGVITFGLYFATFIVVEYRRDVAWERRIHPHQYP